MLARNGLVVATVLLLASGCGKKGPLLYPDQLIAQPPQLKLEQTGTQLRLSFELPTRDQAGHRLKDLEAFQLERRVCTSTNCAGCASRYQHLQTIVLSNPAPAERQGNLIRWYDVDVRPGEQYQYRLYSLQQGGIAGPAVTSPVAGILPPPDPPLLRVVSVRGGSITLACSGGAPAAAIALGCVVYRLEAATVFQQLTPTPLSDGHYADQAVQPDLLYQYRARMVIKRQDGIIAESNLSPAVSARLSDD